MPTDILSSNSKWLKQVHSLDWELATLDSCCLHQLASWPRNHRQRGKAQLETCRTCAHTHTHIADSGSFQPQITNIHRYTIRIICMCVYIYIYCVCLRVCWCCWCCCCMLYFVALLYVVISSFVLSC